MKEALNDDFERVAQCFLLFRGGLDAPPSVDPAFRTDLR
jgi:hypothetical protein